MSQPPPLPMSFSSPTSSSERREKNISRCRCASLLFLTSVAGLLFSFMELELNVEINSRGAYPQYSAKFHSAGVDGDGNGPRIVVHENPAGWSSSPPPFTPVRILTATTLEYQEKAYALANRLALFNQTLYIAPMGYVPEPYPLHPPPANVIFDPPLVTPASEGILQRKLRAISSAVNRAPIPSHVLWIDADTLVLNDVSRITTRSASDNCDFSIKVRGHRNRKFYLAAGLIAVNVNRATRSFFDSAYHLSLSGEPCCEAWDDRNSRPWFQDQLSLLTALERSVGSGNGVKLCDLNTEEMYFGRPHAGQSGGFVNETTVTYHGRPISKDAACWEQRLLEGSDGREFRKKYPKGCGESAHA